LKRLPIRLKIEAKTMSDTISWLQMTELDRSNQSSFSARIARAEAKQMVIEPRDYPGFPTWQLPRERARWLSRLDAALQARRSSHVLDTLVPSPNMLGRILQHAHGISGSLFRGPTPSAGGLQALELYLVHWRKAWLPPGVYHYDRRRHQLAQVVAGANESAWLDRVPSLRLVSGGALLWLIIGDSARVSVKYGERADRFLLLEAGHLMQNLCLLSNSLGLVTLPLGGVFEREVARELKLPANDLILYEGVCGRPIAARPRIKNSGN
jgi:SagB-type dehydrogenase family enzyme